MVKRYIIFALLATLLNLAMQWVSFALYSGEFSIYIAMIFGTLSGLVLKYVLDKKFIFYHKPRSKKDDGIKFMLYSAMGLFTTLIFWIFELAFDAMLDAKYLGATVGLSVGYIVKYYLDKKYVFKESF
ncbi:MAG: GtrA family protein [Sulfuricurvum sp.]